MTNLSAAELVFAQRMLPHFIAGKSAEEAARAVLEDDVRLIGACFDRSHSHFVDMGDGRSATTREGRGDVIARHLSATVYSRLAG